MRFTHTADCHIGGHRDPRLRILTEEAFTKFVDGTLKENVDFCLIAGDLFDTALPGIDALKTAVQQLSRLKKNNIPVYAIPGSHDYSPSGKTIISVLEEASLLVNVCKGVEKDGKFSLKYTKDATGVLLTGILGKRGMLDKELYEHLELPSVEGKKIFLFHTALQGLVPENMPAQSIKILPDGFFYYAGGHVHIVQDHTLDGKQIVYPGPLFPNSFDEFEELQHGGYFLYEDGTLKRKDIVLKNVVKLSVDVQGLSAEEANTKLQELDTDVADAIVLLRIQGKLSAGSPADVDIRKFVSRMNDAYVVLRNTARLTSKEFEAQEHSPQGDIEETILEEHKGQLQLEGKDGLDLAKELLKTLSREQQEGEKRYEYEASVVKEALGVLEKRR